MQIVDCEAGEREKKYCKLTLSLPFHLFTFIPLISIHLTIIQADNSRHVQFWTKRNVTFKQLKIAKRINKRPGHLHVCNWNSSNSLKSDIIEEKWCWFPFKTPFFSTFTFKVSSFHLCKYCLVNTIHVKLPDALFSNEVGHQIKSGIYLINFIIKSIRERLRLANVKLHVTNLPNKFAVRISIVWHTK